MRLDHLLSREKMLLGTAAYFPGSGEWKAGVECCLILRVPKGILEEEIWGCSSAGRASALHAEGQEFDPPHLHHTALRGVVRVTSEQTKKHGRIAQMVRAHA